MERAGLEFLETFDGLANRSEPACGPVAYIVTCGGAARLPE